MTLTTVRTTVLYCDNQIYLAP